METEVPEPEVISAEDGTTIDMVSSLSPPPNTLLKLSMCQMQICSLLLHRVMLRWSLENIYMSPAQRF